MLYFFGICFWGVFTAYSGNSICAQENAVQDSTLLQDDSQNISNSSISKFDSLQWADFQSHIPSRENKAFAVGEHLVFEIAYKFVTAGTATMSIPDTQWVYGRPCYHVVTTARSNKFFDNLFKVRDRVESCIDMEGLFPWKFEKHIREGKYRANKYVDYDQVNQRAIYSQKDTTDVPPFVQGMLSSFYYVRTVPLKVGKPFAFHNYSDRKLYPLQVVVHKKDRIKTPAGTFDCIVVEPVLRGKGIFNQKGRLIIWLTDDERRIPVLMKSKIAVGYIDVRLTSIETKFK